jgi:hypothetical protein
MKHEEEQVDQSEPDIRVLDAATKIIGKKVFKLRKVGVYFAISLLLDVVLTLVIAFGVNDLHQAIQQEQKISCIDGNRLRASESHLFDHIFEHIEGKNPTNKSIRDFAPYYADVTKSLKPRACTKLYG